ncbi:hypothetical protein ACX40Y_04070 [Sphingomonas sp. RS6]
MKLTIVVPSQQYLEQAGVRIRYRRITAALARQGTQLDLVPIDAMAKSGARSTDVLLVSKCQDARAVAVARAARAEGIDVGIDLFDDYFSQQTDSRFAKQRDWLRAIGTHASFYLCSTPAMRGVAERYLPGLPGHILNDPAVTPDPAALSAAIAAKAEDARASRRIPVLWFGMGDNPNFPVGLHDLAAYGDALAAFGANGYAVDLTILTNARALVPGALAVLRHLPVRFQIDIWSEQREQAALAANLISFLPVNAQNFSIVKSPNRALSALTGGTQILARGYPLYRAFDRFAYRSAGEFVDDLQKGTLRHGAATMAAFMEMVARTASPEREATALHEFLASLRRPAPDDHDRRPAAILHGLQSGAGIHRFAQAHGMLSFGSPFTPGGAEYDAHWGFFGEAKTPALRLSETMLARLPAASARQAIRADRALGKGPSMMLPAPALASGLPLEALKPCFERDAPGRAMLYSAVMTQTRQLFESMFGPLHIIESELDATMHAARAPDDFMQRAPSRVA